MKKYIVSFLTLAPQLTYAAGNAGISDLGELVNNISGYMGKIIGLLVTLALVVFFWRIVISIYKVGANPKAVADGKRLLLWGLVALFVMVSVWGIIVFIGDAIGISSGGNAIIPQLEGHK